MSTAVAIRKTKPLGSAFIAWLPVFVLPVLAAAATAHSPSWIFMWAVALASFASFKWLTFATFTADHPVTLPRAAAYLLLWPGMDAAAFFARTRTQSPATRELAIGLCNIAIGLALLAAGIFLLHTSPLAAGWLGMAGIVFVLHFGVARVQSFALRRAGINARPIMQAPLLAHSLSDFWGRRWNLAFRDCVHAFVFRPLVGRIGGANATLAVFLISGIIHDVVISAAAGAGYGLPTLYFLVQGLALLFERSQLGRRWSLGRGLTGRIFAAAVVLLPVGLLFHPPFVQRVAVPMLEVLARGLVPS